MPWYHWLLSERMKKSICAYLIQRYLGQFFEEKLTSDQLSVDLYNGIGSVEKISLDVQALNELSETQNWPLEFVDGFVEKLQISIPWTTILSEPSFVEVSGLKITVQPKQRSENAASMFESMWDSMTSSLKLAEEYAKQESKNSNDDAPYEGLELFANTIDSVLSRVKVKFVNSVIQLEHVPTDSMKGVGIIINIDLIEYSDEAGSDPSKEEVSEKDEESDKKAYVVQTFTTKNFNIQGVTLSTVEFPSKARTFSRSMMSEISQYYGEEVSHTSTTVADKSENEEMDNSQSSTANTPAGMPKEFETQRHVVLCAKFANKQVIKVHMKQSEDASVPKVAIEVNLGHLVIFLSPRQVHILLELASGLASPDSEDHSNVPQKSKCVQKPMTAIDYQRVENELQQKMRPPYMQVAGLQAVQGWSGAPLEENEPEENFFPMRNSASEMYDSAMSGLSGSLESSLSSSAPSTVFTEHTGRTRRKSSSRGHNVDIDPTAEISHFRVQIASLGMVLLQEDLLNLNADGSTFVLSSVVQMQQTAKNFFHSLMDFRFLDSAESNFDQGSEAFNNCCKLSHIRMLAVPVHFVAKEKTTMSSFSITGNLEASKFQILECLYDSSKDNIENIPLLTFEDTSSPSPNLCLTFKHTERTVRSSRKNANPRTEIGFNLGKCLVEFDITIIDRITSLLNSPPVCVIEKKHNLHKPWTGETLVLDSQSQECITDIKISSPCLSLKVRFPIPDFRPAHDLNRTPWWKRNVRPDYLTLKCYNAIFETSSHSSQTYNEYSFTCRGADIYYCETEKGVPLYIAKVGLDEPYLSSMQDVLTHPRVNVKLFPQKEQLEQDQPEDIMTQSTFSPSFLGQPDKGPFSTKRVFHQSNTPHDKQPLDEEEMIIPGNKEEIEEFMRSATESTRMHIDISLPAVKMQLISKHIYEMIYNRINNDLLLWESMAPKIKTKDPQSSEAFSTMIPETQDIFSACKSGVQYESESDSEDISEEGAILFYSTYERPKSVISDVPTAEEVVKQSNLVLSLQITYGILSCNAPVRDSTTNNVIPGHIGDFLLNVENTTVFLVNGYKGDPELGYVCVQVGRAELYHCDMIPSPSIKIGLPKDREIARHLRPTIYKSEKRTLAGVQKESVIRDMLTLACRIESKHETHHVKTITIALGLNQATLRHRMCLEPNTWISQMLDFFNVNDYPITGYKSKEVLTELHIHMWDCAIDYRPLYLPLRSVITLGCFSMTSYLSEKSNTSTLRFIAEDCGLFISDKAPPKNGVPSSAPVDLKKDYVNVIDLGLFELSLRTADKKSKTHPHIDLRASNDCVHIYTCSDSGRALTQLITYIATDGDLKFNETVSNTDSAYSSPRHHPADQELIRVEGEVPLDICNLTTSQQHQVNKLLGEALQEPEVEPEQVETSSLDDSDETNVRDFSFPGENPAISNKTVYKPFPQVTQELGNVPSSNDEESSDDDFFFVKKEDSSSIPEIKWLTNDPVRILENHFFVPVGKKDLLQTPDNFPVPKYKYTLCEMNLIWHMYGGNDFKLRGKKNEKTEKRVAFESNRFSNAVYFNKDEVTFSKDFTSRSKPNDKLPWKVRGGINRDQKVLMELELNKVKFQHEIYPETTYHASRQVLLVSELEIRDVLANSEFNKFLYQYTSEAKPKQSQGHMIAIKAVHIRPDKNLTAEECCIQLSLLPLRFNIDQDSLKFLVNFFSELGEDSEEESDTMSLSSSKQHIANFPPPIMTVNEEKEEQEEKEPKPLVDENLIDLDPYHFDEKPQSPENTPMVDSSSQPVFFRNVVFSPEVTIKIDYQGKHIELADGSLVGLLLGLVMGLAQLNRSELRLKRISYRKGLLGVNRLANFLLTAWFDDIKRNQLQNILSGVGPMNSVVQLFQGIKDLFWMPIEQYQKDGRLMRGFQRGANSFTTSTAMAALELTTRLIHLIQLTAETAYDMLSPGPSFRKMNKLKGRKKRYNQPQDIREGVANAYSLLKEGIGETADTIVKVASHEHEQKGYSGAVGGVLRQIPPTILKPIIIATEATSNVLGGMKYQLIPDARNEANQKWRTKDD